MTRLLRVWSDGWLYDVKSNEWVRLEGYEHNDKVSLENGWLRAWLPEEKKWSWPVANEPAWSSGSYSQMYPTRYNWRSDVERVAREVIDAFPGRVWAVTYLNHPPSYPRERTSIDFWHYSGRGYSIDPTVGQQVFDFIFYDPNPPDIWWIIWNHWMWTRSGGWEAAPWGPADSDPQHTSHVHVTYLD